MQCVNCGKELNDGTKFCPACGAKQPQQSQEQAQYNNEGQNGYQSQTQYNNQQYSNQNQQYNNQQYSNQNQQYNNQQYSNQNQQYNNQGQYNNAGAGGYSNMQGGGYNAAIKRREIATCIILSIVTCGIYGIYWQICIVDELNAAVGRQGETTGVMVFLLTLITCGIYGWYWFYKAGEKVNELKARKGIQESSTGLLFLVLQFFGLGIVNYCIIQGELNDVATL